MKNPRVRALAGALAGVVSAVFAAGCHDTPSASRTPARQAPEAGSASAPSKLEKVVKSDAEWKEQLSDMEYHVVREKGTERAFTGATWDEKRAGSYYCVACGLELFRSDTKFDSGTGWPSFFDPVSPEHVRAESDTTLGMVRTEVLCARCDGHLGHVFRDGPKPTGLRYCINSASLRFAPAD